MQARSWIHAGRVRVNGRVTESPDQWIDFDRDRVLFDGKPLQSKDPVYILIYSIRSDRPLVR
jgi:16S rRNA U516 pseudouridylate synthase RsuA-like enzyme